MYLAFTVHIWHSYLLLCVDDNTVSDYRYDLDFKGQGQLYLTFMLRLDKRKFLSFFPPMVLIFRTMIVCVV